MIKNNLLFIFDLDECYLGDIRIILKIIMNLLVKKKCDANGF